MERKILVVMCSTCREMHLVHEVAANFIKIAMVSSNKIEGENLKIVPIQSQ